MEKIKVKDMIGTKIQEIREKTDVCFFCKLNRSLRSGNYEIRLKKNRLIINGVENHSFEFNFCPVCGEGLGKAADERTLQQEREKKIPDV